MRLSATPPCVGGCGFSAGHVRAQATPGTKSYSHHEQLPACLLLYTQLRELGTGMGNRLGVYTRLDFQHFLLRDNRHLASFGDGEGGSEQESEKPTAVLSYKLSV